MNINSSQFVPVIDLPSDYEVYDFSQGYDPERSLSSPYGIGKYNEKRPTMYDQEMFEGLRNIHMGIDIGAPVGTEVKSFAEGEIFLFGNNDQPGDYGYTLVLKYQIEDKNLYALYGHLSAKSIVGKCERQKVAKGEVIAWLGNKHENGGWNSHLHFQLSWLKPEVPDMPGVVSEKDRGEALKTYPDPQVVLGKLY